MTTMKSTFHNLSELKVALTQSDTRLSPPSNELPLLVWSCRCSSVRRPPGPEHLLGQLRNQVGGRGRREPPARLQAPGPQEGRPRQQGSEIY